MTDLTPLIHANLADIIAHINADHSDDVLTFAIYDSQLHSKPTPTSAELTQIYQEGLQICASGDDGNYSLFIPFDQPLTVIDDLHKFYVKLLKKAGKTTGRRYVDDTIDVLTVLATEMIGNFVRLTVQLPTDTPTDKAGFAYLLKINDNDVRYYTLRKAWNDNGTLIGYIDIFTHDDTAGSLWAKSVQVGDTLTSTRRYPEKTEHLAGQVLLIGDETSLPTVLRVLELNTFDKPIVVACLHNKSDEIYLKECTADYTMLTYDKPMDLLPQLNDLIKDKNINTVWTAMESELIKEIRASFKEKLALSRDEMVIKVYWRLTSD